MIHHSPKSAHPPRVSTPNETGTRLSTPNETCTRVSTNETYARVTPNGTCASRRYGKKMLAPRFPLFSIRFEGNLQLPAFNPETRTQVIQPQVIQPQVIQQQVIQQQVIQQQVIQQQVIQPQVVQQQVIQPQVIPPQPTSRQSYCINNSPKTVPIQPRLSVPVEPPPQSHFKGLRFRSVQRLPGLETARAAEPEAETIDASLHMQYVKESEHRVDAVLTILSRLAGRERAPCDMTFVIDRSASMKGPPLKWSMDACRKVLEELNGEDRLSVVVFDANVAGFQPLTYMTEEAKSNLLSQLHRLYPQAGSNLYGALGQACRHQGGDLVECIYEIWFDKSDNLDMRWNVQCMGGTEDLVENVVVTPICGSRFRKLHGVWEPPSSVSPDRRSIRVESPASVPTPCSHRSYRSARRPDGEVLLDLADLARKRSIGKSPEKETLRRFSPVKKSRHPKIPEFEGCKLLSHPYVTPAIAHTEELFQISVHFVDGSERHYERSLSSKHSRHIVRLRKGRKDCGPSRASNLLLFTDGNCSFGNCDTNALTEHAMKYLSDREPSSLYCFGLGRCNSALLSELAVKCNGKFFAVEECQDPLSECINEILYKPIKSISIDYSGCEAMCMAERNKTSVENLGREQRITSRIQLQVVRKPGIITVNYFDCHHGGWKTKDVPIDFSCVHPAGHTFMRRLKDTEEAVEHSRRLRKIDAKGKDAREVLTKQIRRLAFFLEKGEHPPTRSLIHQLEDVLFEIDRPEAE